AASFVLGALSEPEMDAVRDHLADCAELHEEFTELGAVVPALDVAVPLMEPPSALRDRIMAVGAADLDARRQVDARVIEPVTTLPESVTTEPEPAGAPAPASEPIPIETARRRRPLKGGGGVAGAPEL